ncbi:MAG: pyrimidine-nucleoside phosphorylase, partial [Chloroflexota bacterium]
SLAQARELATEAQDSGEALSRFRQMVAAQGGDVAQVDDPRQLPTAPVIEEVTAPHEGTIAAMNAGALGWAAVHLGAGRQKKGEPIDHAVGFIMPVKVGDRVQKGQPLATIHARDEDALQQARQEILAALEWSEQPVEPLPHFYGTINAEGDNAT